MLTPSKTVQSTNGVLARQNVAAGAVVISNVLDVSAIFEGTFFARIGRRAATALSAPVNIRIEGSADVTGNDKWVALAQISSTIAAAEAEAVNGTVASGTNVITVASTTNLIAGDLIYIDNGTPANSEWGRIKSISANVSVTIEDNLTNAQTGSTLYDQADIFNAITVDFGSIKRVRVVCDGAGSGQNFAVEVLCTTLDAIAV